MHSVQSVYIALVCHYFLFWSP